MDLSIESPDFQGRGLAVRLGWLRSPRLVIDGSEVKGKRGRFLVRDNHGQEVTIRLISNHIDPVPKVAIGPTEIQLARPLIWYEYLWIALPILMALHGGALGAICGVVAIRASAQLFRGKDSQARKFLLSGLISVAAVIAYLGLSFALVSLVRGRGEQKWTTTASKDGGFVVAMPGQPTETVSAVKLPVGSLQVHVWTVARGRDTAFIVCYSDYPEDFIKAKSADAVLDGARDGAVSETKGQLLNEVHIDLKGYSGRDITIAVAAGKGASRDRMFLVGRRLYQLLVGTVPSEVRSAEVERFFKSFRLTGNGNS